MLSEAQNLNIDGQCFSRKQTISPDNVFLFETLRYNTQKIFFFVIDKLLFCHHNRSFAQ